jgi:hypothetical protein
MSLSNYPSDEWLQAQLEETVCEQYELHGWATAVSVANPLDILIMVEEDDDSDLKSFEIE